MGLLNSTIGQKFLVGITGLVMAGFLLGHMAGNLLIFLGPEIYNSYGHALVSNKLLLYGTELVLGLSVIIHVVLTIKLTQRNRKANPVAYEAKATGLKKTSLASKTMVVHGPILLIFIIVHLNTLKFGTYYEVTYNGVVMRDLFRLMLEMFSNVPYVIGYIICLLLLAMHLKHGVASVFNTLGLISEKRRPLIERLSLVYSAVVVLGFISQPLYLMIAGR